MTLPRVRWSDDDRLASYAGTAPRMPWEKFMRTVFHPLPGEHVFITGSTGSGKTQLQNEILPKYPFVAVFVTKNQDSTMDRLVREGGYMRLDKWRRLSARDVPRRVIWPKTGKLSEVKERQQEVFSDAIEHIWAEGGNPADAPVGWAMAVDEVWWFTNFLKLGEYLKIILQQGRSAGISIIGATQRPAWVPLEFYSQPTHLFFFRETDNRNLDRIGDINAPNKRLVRDLVSNLDKHQVLYINTVTGKMVRTRTPAPL